jgi:threonine/homoserine/homoserine lactone efflux protein
MTLVPTHQLLAFALAAFILIVIPGPSVIFVIGRALAYGRSVALASVLGNSLGLFVVMVLVALGLGAVVAESAVVFNAIKVAGAAYMVWLGVQALRHRRDLHVDDPSAAPLLPWPVAVRQGFVVGIGNPKAFMIFAAVLPQFVTPAEGQVPAQMLLLGMLAVTLGLACDSVWAVLASRLRSWFNASPARGRRLTATGGVSMIGLGLTLAATGRPE